MLHKNITLSDRHAAHNWEYPNAAARTSAVGFVSGDEGKLALQTDDSSFWALKSLDPVWVPLGGTSSEHNHDSRYSLLGHTHATDHAHTNKEFLDSLTGLKTINGQSISGTGNITIQSGEGESHTHTNLSLLEDMSNQLAAKESNLNKDASGGYAGLTAYKLNLKNALGTITSWFTTATTAARTWTMPDKDGTVAMTSDITGTNSVENTGDETTATIKSKLGITTLSGDNTGDQTAATVPYTPAGNIAATTVQGAINELDTEKATSAQGAKADTALQPDAIGVTVQAYDADTVKADVTQTFSAVQKTTVTPSSASLTVNIGAVMDGIIQPEAGGALTFTGIAAGIGFELLFINTTNFAITNGGNIKAPSTLFQTLSNTGRYRLTGKCFDGTNIDLDISAAHV